MGTTLLASPSNVVRIYTFKEGLLSTVAHDLRLTLERWTIEVDDDGAVKGRFHPATLRVDGPMRSGRLEVNGLSDKDRREIQGTVGEKLLHTARFPDVQLEGRVSGEGPRRAFEGTLTLVGRTAPLRAAVEVNGARVTVEVELQPTRWGIAPYKALLGAIRLQDRVRVTLEAVLEAPSAVGAA